MCKTMLKKTAFKKKISLRTKNDNITNSEFKNQLRFSQINNIVKIFEIGSLFVFTNNNLIYNMTNI